MKKILIASVLVIAALIAALGFGGEKLLADPVRLPEKTEAPSSLPAPQTVLGSQTPQTEPEAALQESASLKQTDFAAIYALLEPDEVVMTIDGREITWQDYFFAFYSQAYSMEQTFEMYQYYGMVVGWGDQADEEGHTYAELVASLGEQDLRQILLAETLAEEENVRLLPEEEEAIQADHQDLIVRFCGEDGTEEQLFQKLWEERWLSRELYWRIMRYDVLTQAVSRSLYGEEGSLLPEEQVLAWMEEQGVVSVDHILISTIDAETNQRLDEAASAEKAELARQLAEELQAIEDPAEREARFLELKAEHGEDPGAEEGGYVFGPGIMVQEFYEGALALEEGAISEPVQTSYGYHVILRRPLRADDTILSVSGEQSARSLMAQILFNERMQERYDAQVIEYAPGFEAPNVLDYQVSVAP
jgi:hypothetical protein